MSHQQSLGLARDKGLGSYPDLKDLEPAKIVARSLACHSAMRAGEKLTIAEMENLFDLLFAAENPYNCPHGRPTIIELPLSEIHRRFGRPV